MAERTKRQHVVPRFYLRQFTQPDGELWTHDCVSQVLRKSTPEKTAFETNIYTPLDENGDRIEIIEDALAKIESKAASLYPKLLAFQSLEEEEKLDFSAFLATMFTRSPAQLRQFAQLMGQVVAWRGMHEMERMLDQREKRGELSALDEAVLKLISNPELLTMSVDRRVGLQVFQQAEVLMDLMVKMTWSYEISQKQQIVTSDYPVFWFKAGGPPDIPGYGFGLGNPFAVIPFPLSPNVILRLDWQRDGAWKKFSLDRQRAKLANQYQAKHKEKLMFFRDREEGLISLAMKYRRPVNQIDVGAASPQIEVVRSLQQAQNLKE